MSRMIIVLTQQFINLTMITTVNDMLNTMLLVLLLLLVSLIDRTDSSETPAVVVRIQECQPKSTSCHTERLHSQKSKQPLKGIGGLRRADFHGNHGLVTGVLRSGDLYICVHYYCTVGYRFVACAT